MIRKCTGRDFEDIFEIINDGAGSAEGVTEFYELQTKYGADNQEQERWNNEIGNMFDGKRMSDSIPESFLKL